MARRAFSDDRYLRTKGLTPEAESASSSRLADLNFFHPGFRIHCQKDSGSRIRIKVFLTQKIVSKLSEI
jgi:hypothetical protein